jgi:serine/threonine protein kinase/tetratricopeptide (TPR) repeat protein
MGRTQRLSQPEEFGKYQLIARLAHGRMGDVYKAKSHGVEGFEKILVIKALNPGLVGIPGLVDTVIDEAKRSVALSHANVAQVFDLGRTDDDRFYLATEFISGFDLARAGEVARSAGKSWPQELAIFVVSEVAKGLDYAHRRKDFNFNNLNILHRDLAPSNVMLSYDGEVKLTDFGIAKAMELVGAIDADDTRRRLLYAAPEVARGQESTRQSDIFSLGLILYELLAGVHPYSNDAGAGSAANNSKKAVAEFTKRVQTAKIEPITAHAQVPRKLQQIVESMLVPDPAGRATSAGQIYEELIGYLFGNNLRADNRSLGQFIQELRREEQRVAPEDVPLEVGMDEISISDLSGVFTDDDLVDDFAENVMGASRPLRGAVPQLSSPTHTDLPSAKIQELFRKEMAADQASRGNSRGNSGGNSAGVPELPGALHEHFLSARAGNGKAVLVSGNFGMGRDYLTDQLVNALGWRGNTQAFGIQSTRDDVYRPFGVLSDLILRCLHETVAGTTDHHQAALQLLGQLDGVGSQAVDTLASLWDIKPMPLMDYEHRRSNFTVLFAALLRDFCRNGPVILVIDRVERVDSLTLDVLREVVAAIETMPVMLVMTTYADGAIREAFDLGNPANLETIRVVGPSEPELTTLAELSESAAHILLLLTLGGQPMSQADFSQVLGIPSDKLMQALRELADSGAVRLPQTGIFLASSSELDAWIARRFQRRTISEAARSLARYYKHRVVRGDIDRLTPTLLRLHALAGDRRRMLGLAGAYSRWLEGAGWTGVAIEFYRHVADLLAKHALGSPQARIDYMLLRAELALELARLDDARASLEPIAALSESLRNEHGMVRGQLLFGRMAMQQDDLDEALTYFRRAANVARRLNDPDLLARSLLALAGWHQRYGDPSASKEHLDGALNLFSRWGTYRLDLRTRSMMLQRAVEMWTTRGMLARAEQLSADLSRLAEVSELNAVQCRALWARARVLSEIGEHRQALDLLDRAEANARSGDLTALRIELIREKAGAALSAGEFERAIDVARYLVDLAGRHGDFHSQQRARDLEATASCILGQNAHAAMEHLQTSLKRAETRGVPLDIYLSHLNLARAFAALGRDDLANEHQNHAARLAERMRYPDAAYGINRSAARQPG